MSDSGAFEEQTGEREAWQQPASASPRPRAKLPTEMPRPAGAREASRVSALVSLVLHLVIIGLLLLPALLSPTVRAAIANGAGGAGPAGGGGGSGGAFGTRETLRYVRIAPDPVPEQAKPVVVPTPTPVPPKPVEVKPPTPQVQPQATPPPTAVPATGGAAGTGNTSGAGGAGPGSGGGTGSGVGTGTGSANGPGTGGGNDEIHPPFSTQMLLPPQPVPARLKQKTIGVDFDIDSTGTVLNVTFEETSDRGYNKKIRDAAKQFRFRPATRPDGRPIRAMYHVDWLLF